VRKKRRDVRQVRGQTKGKGKLLVRMSRIQEERRRILARQTLKLTGTREQFKKKDACGQDQVKGEREKIAANLPDLGGRKRGEDSHSSRTKMQGD